MQVGNVTWVAELDTNKALRDFKNFEKQIGSATRDLNNITITPTVDHSNLIDLNRHFDLKLKHYKQLQAYFNANPLKIKTEYGKDPSRISGGSSTQQRQIEGGSTLLLRASVEKSNNILTEGFKRNEQALKRVEQASKTTIGTAFIQSSVSAAVGGVAKQLTAQKSSQSKELDKLLTSKGVQKLAQMSNNNLGTNFDDKATKKALIQQMTKSGNQKELMMLARGGTLKDGADYHRLNLPKASDTGKTLYRRNSSFDIAQGMQTGKDYAMGVAKGVQFATPYVMKTIRQVGEILDDELRQTLDEHSPSKKGAEKGRWYVEGVIKGLKEYTPIVADQAKEIGQQLIERIMPEGSEMEKKVQSVLGRIGQGLSFTKTLLLQMGAAAVVFPLLAKGLQIFNQETFDAALQVENLSRLISFSTGKDGAMELARIRKETDALGISFTASAEALKDFSSATMGTTLNASSGELVSSFQKSFAAFGLSTEDQKGAFLALSQMASKGVVSMEELRQQLGERVPAAMSSAASSMGLTTAEFNKLVESGKVLSEDLLPLLAAKMETDTSLGLRESLKSTQSELSRFENNMFALQAAVGEAQLAMAKFGLPIVNSALTFLIQNADTLLTLVAALAVGLGGNLLYSLTRVVGMNFLLSASFGAVTLAVKGLIASLLTLAPYVAAVLAVTFAVKNLVSYFNAGTESIKKYADAIKDAKTAQDSLKGSTPKSSDGKKYNRDLIKDAMKMDWKLPSAKEQWDEFVDFVTGRSAKMAKQFVDDSDTISSALQAVNDTIQGSYTSTKTVDLGNGKTVGADISDQTVKQVQQRLGELRNKQAQLRFSISVLGDEKDQEKVGKLQKALGDVNKEITRVSTQPFESVVALEKQLKAVQALIEETEAKAAENRAKGMEDRARSYDVFAQEARQKEEMILAAIEKRNTAIKATNDLFLKQIVSLRVLQREMANIDYTTSLAGINGEIQAAQQFLNGGNANSYDQAMRNSKATQINAKLVLSTQEFSKFETSVKDKLSKLDPALKQSVADYIGVDNLDQAILDKKISPQALAQLTGDLVPSQLKDTIEQSDDLKSLITLGQEYLGTWTEIKQTQLDAANAAKDQAEADKQRNADLRNFQNQIQDFDTGVQDYFKQRARALEDFDTKYADIATQNRRATRNLVEQFNDLGRSIDTQIQQVTNQLANTSKEIKRKILGNLARQAVNFGGGGVFSAFFDFLDSVITDSNSLQAQALTLEEQRVQTAQETLALSVQIRGLQEQATDLEKQRLSQLTELIRAQQDFVQSQAAGWLAIQRQSAEMVLQAEAMGLNFAGIANSLNAINKSYASIHNSIASFSTQIANSGSGMGGNAVGLKGEAASGLNSIVAVGKYLKGQGYAIGEHSAFNGGRVETSGHARNSNHYRDLALDINADQMKGGEKANLDKLYTWLDANRKLMGITELIWNGRGGKGHETHLHVAFGSKEWKEAFTQAIGGKSSTNANNVAELLKQVGFPASAIPTMVAIAKAESGLDPNAYNGNAKTGDKSYGLFQINMLNKLGPARRKSMGLTSNEQLYDPETNARAALQLYNQSGFRPWSTYKRGEHKKFLGQSGSALTSNNSSRYTTSGLSPISAPNMSSAISGMGGGLRPAQLRSIVGMFSASSMSGSTSALNNKASQLNNTKIALNAAQKAQLEQDKIAQQLNAEKALAEQAKTLRDTFEQQVNAMRGLNKEFLSLSRNAKGFLTYTENTQIAAEDLKNSFREFRANIEDVGLSLKKTLDMTDNPQEVNKAIDSYVEALKKRTDISPAFLEKLTKELIPQLREGARSLTDLTPQLKAIENGLADIEEQTMKTNAELTLFNQLLKLNSDFSSAAQSFSELMRGEDVAMSTSFDKLSKQAELANKFAESRRGLKLQIQQLKLEIADPNSVIDKQEAKGQLSALSYALEQLSPEIEFKVRAKADFQFDFDSSQAKMNSILNLQQGIGDRKRANNVFDGTEELRLAKINENATKLALQLKEIEDLRSSFKGDENMLQYLSQLEQETTRLAEIDFAGIESQVNTFALAIGQPLETAFTSLFTDVIKGTKTVQDVLVSFLDSIAGYFAQIAAKMAAQNIMGALFPTQQPANQSSGFSFGGILSGLFGGLFGGGGGGSNPLTSGVLSIASGVTIPSFANGGEILGLGLGMAKAMQREGVGAIPIVGHIGEQMLSAKNGDAQRYRQWKSPRFEGFSANKYSNSFSSRPSDSNKNAYSTTFNITTPNADSFRASISQMSQQERLRQRRLNRNS